MSMRAIIDEFQTPENQRGTVRVRIYLTVPGSVERGDGAPVLIHNLSTSGMLIETQSDLAIGQKVSVTLPETAEASATVVWQSETLRGCRFDRPLARAALSAARLLTPLPRDFDPIADPDGVAQPELLPQRLRRLRRDQGLSQAELSAKTGLSKPSIWAWETGKTVPRRRSLLTLADAFGVSQQALLDCAAMSDPEGQLVFGKAIEPAGHGHPAFPSASIQNAVDSSRREIAAVAGVETAKVRIIIEF